jgi:hypothetical protein
MVGVTLEGYECPDAHLFPRNAQPEIGFPHYFIWEELNHPPIFCKCTLFRNCGRWEFGKACKVRRYEARAKSAGSKIAQSWPPKKMANWELK